MPTPPADAHPPRDHPAPDSPGARESALAARAVDGDGDAFGDLVTPYLARAYQLARRVLGNREDAEDLVQDAAVRAYERLAQFDRARPFAPWFLRVVFNLALRRRESVVRLKQDSLDEVSELAAPAGETVDPDREAFWQVFRAAVERLPPRQRSIVMLFDVDGLSGAEIAEQLEVSQETVRWHLHQARKTLRAVMAPYRDRLPGEDT
ncbi:MAG: sigma-70 family RNA polymerase sigma factor [Gemmatimonadaceae bacterium]|nr:sigma-70 family RNA polymerase sigma factor [Gemmatimonadaceae bacterium]